MKNPQSTSVKCLLAYGTNQKGYTTLIDDKNHEYDFVTSFKGRKYWRCRFFQWGCKVCAISSDNGNELLNDPVPNHSNQLMAKTARKAEEEAIKKSSNNAKLPPGRVLCDVSFCPFPLQTIYMRIEASFLSFMANRQTPQRKDSPGFLLNSGH